jgi:hypothetical protein
MAIDEAYHDSFALASIFFGPRSSKFSRFMEEYLAGQFSEFCVVNLIERTYRNKGNKSVIDTRKSFFSFKLFCVMSRCTDCLDFCQMKVCWLCCPPPPEETLNITMGRPYSALGQSSVLPNVNSLVDEGLPRSALPQVSPFVKGDLSNFEAVITDSSRQDSAEFWSEQGATEQFAFSSFALFSQRLLAVAAPSTLVAESFQCAQEAMEHARLSFGLASAFKGEIVNAGTHDQHTFQVSADLDSLFVDTIEERCVADTLTALRAAQRANSDPDPIVSAVWSKMAIDKAYHASFAWRVILWILDQDPSKFSPLLQETVQKKLSILKLGEDEKEVVLKMTGRVASSVPSFLSSSSFTSYGPDYINALRVLGSTTGVYVN